MLGSTTPATTTTPAQTEIAVLGAAEFTASAGLAQKGPLIKGSGVTVQELSKSLVPNGKQYSFQISSDLGTFEPNAKFTSQYVSVAAAGYYFDESSGVVSSGQITLYGLSDLSADSSLNVNLLTTLAFQRIQVLITQSGLSFSAARTQAEGEVLTALGIRKGAIGSAFGTLDIAAGTDGARALAAVSSIFAFGNTAGNLTQLMANFQSDLADDGKISNVATLATLAASSRAINPTQVADNLNRKYAATNAYFMPADISNWVDQDSDGLLGQFKFQVNDASASSVLTLPASVIDPYVATGISATSGRLVVNGAVVSGSVFLKKGDVLGVQPPAGALPDGALTVYVMSGASRIARVTFVKGLAAIDIAPANPQAQISAKQQFVAIGTFTDGSSADITAQAIWASSSPSVASINSRSGLAAVLAAGTTSISASLGKLIAKTNLTGMPAQLTSIAVSPKSASLNVGGTQQLQAIGTYSDGSTADVTSAAAWASDATAVAMVTGGRVTAVAQGGTVIRATGTGGVVSAPVVITVNPIIYTAPVAVAGNTQSVSAGSVVTLNGQSSYDTNSPALPLSYSWTLLTKPLSSTAVLSNASGSIASFTADIPGTYQAMLMVSNGKLSSIANVVITAGGTIPVVSLAVKGSSTFVLKADGSLWAWGYNFYGQLGTGTQVDVTQPTQIGTGFVWVAPGQQTTTAGKTDGSVRTWGRNGSGSFGDGSNPSAYTIIASPILTQTAASYASAASGSFYTVGLKADGNVLAWGDNSQGSLGDGTGTNRLLPKPIASGFVKIAAGYMHTLGIKSDGTLWAWGYGYDGEVGDGGNQNRYLPTQVSSGFVEIAAGPYHSVGIKSDGTLWAWGLNRSGQLGNGTTTTALTPQYIGSGYKAVSADGDRTFAIKADGSLWAWGQQPLGDGGISNSLVPKLIGTGYATVAAGALHAVAIKTDGSVWTWGYNDQGQLGDGFIRIESLVPKRITLP
ncbi:MAG: Ig-like domain-containing protein [Burkholderiales bacterium]|nr:Ig-like domain-containing protein [Burkholderiales bacterium]